MSGIDEQGVVLPECPYCKEKPYYYTLGEGDGNSPILWLYDSIKSPHKEPIKPAKGYLSEKIINNDIEYVYCSVCDQIMTRRDYPDLLEMVIELAISALRLMER